MYLVLPLRNSLRHFLKSRLDICFGMQCVYSGFRLFRRYGTVFSCCQCEVLDVHLQKRVCQAFVKQLEAGCAESVKPCERVVFIFSDAHAACACFLHLEDQSIDVQGNAATCHVSILLIVHQNAG